MNRRAFIAALGAAASWPLAARAQQAAMPVIGYLGMATLETYTDILAAFRQGLNETGFVEGQNVTIEYLWAENRLERLPSLAKELIERKVTVIVGATPTARAAKAVTSTIPIVSLFGGDPVSSGLVASLNRPAGNLTGVAMLAYSLGAKRLEFLREVTPKTGVIAVLWNPNNPTADSVSDRQDVEMAARAAGQEIFILKVTNDLDFEPAFAAIARRGGSGLLVMADPFFHRRRDQLVALAARHAIPAIYEWREMAVAGGLMSYGANFWDANRQVGIYTGKILKGAKPADLPVMQAVKVELVLNLRTAKTLGVTFPLSLLGRADEVIE